MTEDVKSPSGVHGFIHFHLARPVARAMACVKNGWSLRLVWYDIPALDKLPPSTKFGHPYGITIRSTATIGENCTIRQNVTIGQRRGEDLSEPGAKIGNNVSFGAGCIILGPVNIGDNAIIGAGAVVLQDVPAGCIAVGNPARIIKRDQ